MLEAFQPTVGGLTQCISCTTAPSAAITLGVNVIGCRIKNDGPLMFAVSKTSDVQCTIPTSGTPANGQSMLGPSVETFNFLPNFWISFATTSGTATAYITGGFGI